MKQLEPKTVAVGKNTFYIVPFPAFTASNICGQLVQLLLPVAGGLLSMVGNGVGDESVLDKSAEEAMPALTAAASSISGDKLEKLMQELLITHKNVSYENHKTGEAERMTKEVADELFCGEAQDMFILAFEVCKINFSGFFRKLGDRFGPVIESLTKAADSLNTAS